MNTVTIDVRPLAETLGDFAQAWKCAEPSPPRISFDSPALLFKVLSGKGWELLNKLTGAPLYPSVKPLAAPGAMSKPCIAT
jgi:hypothetical protein